LEPLLWDYRKDFWWIPLTSLLRLGLRCAYLSGRVAEYFTYAVELCSSNTVNDLEDKKRLFSNLLSILEVLHLFLFSKKKDSLIMFDILLGIAEACSSSGT